MNENGKVYFQLEYVDSPNAFLQIMNSSLILMLFTEDMNLLLHS